MEIEEIEKVNNETVLVTYRDGSVKEHGVIKVISRQNAIDIYKQLVKWRIEQTIHNYNKGYCNIDAFDLLPTYNLLFEVVRNYELEDKLQNLSGKFYYIKEKCPFNNNSWFDN